MGFKKRGLTLTDGIKSFTDRIKGLKYFSRIYTKMFKYGTSIIIILGMVLVALNVINTEVLNTSFIKYIINIGMSLAFSLGMTEAIVFCMAGIVKLWKKIKKYKKMLHNFVKHFLFI